MSIYAIIRSIHDQDRALPATRKDRFILGTDPSRQDSTARFLVAGLIKTSFEPQPCPPKLLWSAVTPKTVIDSDREALFQAHEATIRQISYSDQLFYSFTSTLAELRPCHAGPRRSAAPTKPTVEIPEKEEFLTKGVQNEISRAPE